MFISPLFHPKELAIDIFQILLEVYKPADWSKSVRSIIASQTFYSTESKYFYYTYILYEITIYGNILPPVCYVINFLPNIYSDVNGSLFRLLDIIRIIFIILIFLLDLKEFSNGYKILKLKSKEQQGTTTLMDFLINSNLIVDFVILLLYFIVYIIKIAFLSTDLISNTDLINSNEYYFQSGFEYFNIANNFEWELIIECLIIIACLFKFMNLVVLTRRITVFFNYILLAFKTIIAYFFIILFLIITFSFFSNNLWGPNLDEYRDVISSVTGTLLFSIGHFNTSSYKFNFPIWNIIYIFLFFMIFIYFILNSFIGVYMESYRLTVLKFGNSYDFRELEKNKNDIIQKKNK